MRRPILELKDKKILVELSNNSRQTSSHIGKKLKTSQFSVNYRIKKIVDLGVIKRFYPIINYEALGYFKANFFVSLREFDKELSDKILGFFKENKFVRSVYSYFDKWDFEIELIMKRMKDFDTFLEEFDNKFPNITLEDEEIILIDEYKNNSLPSTIIKQETKSFEEIKKEKRVSGEVIRELDDKDLRILSLLSKNSRLSSYKIAEQVGLNADTVLKRIKRLVESNVILGFTTLVDHKKLGLNNYTIMIKVKRLSSVDKKKLIGFVNQNKNIVYATTSIGQHDIIIKLVCEHKELESVVKDLKAKFYDIISDYDVFLVSENQYFNPMPRVMLG